MDCSARANLTGAGGLSGVTTSWVADMDEGHRAPRLDRICGAADHPSLENGGGRRPSRISIRIGAARPSTADRTGTHDPLAQLVGDLPLDIVSQCDESPVPHVLSRTLTPYLQWSACLEEHGGNSNPPSQREYLDPRRIIDLAFVQPPTVSEDEGLTLEEEEEEGVEKGDKEEEEETSKEAGSYNEYIEEESGGEEEEDDQLEEEGESEWKALGDEADRAEAHEEDPEAARRREEIVAGKQPLKFASGVDLPIPNGPAKDPEPPKNDDGDLAAETSSAPARRRRSRSPSPSTSARPPVRAHTDAEHRASSPVLIPSSP
ncbi:hypothetical protein CBR_g16965 [Chara braunii]|uniref:Uncharacterized protein n=1 Tax=Chara braunii TaxID=69332 RepID=A0A388KUF5_CHABU|nr:hypothetical protein CBR_g16965 [Chara braunii]|eukprot:GBG73622.1 hypothetical protein CBR_g16965 [Chara braunii]